MQKTFRNLVYPEPSEHLSFINTAETPHNDPESGVVSLYEEIFDGAFSIPPYDDIEFLEDGTQILTYQIVTNPSSDIIVQMVRWSDSHELSDQIIVQDRLLEKTRNEYVFYRAGGRGGNIIRVCYGDVAAGYHDWAIGVQSAEKLIYENTLAKEDELIALFDLVLREGKRVEATLLDVPENLFHLLMSDRSADGYKQ